MYNISFFVSVGILTLLRDETREEDMFKMRLCVSGIFLLLFIAAASADILLDRVVAVVNKEVITWSELYRKMEMDAPQEIKSLSEDERRKIFNEKQEEYLESLIDIKLQVQEARSMGLTVSEDEISDAINGIKQKYSMDDAVFAASLKKQGYAFDDYKKRLGDQILVSKVVNKLINSKILVTDAEVNDYLSENKNISGTPDTYRIGQIFFKNPGNGESKQKIEKKAVIVVDALKRGEKFDDLARTYSEDASASSGGDLGIIKAEYLGQEFRSVLEGMKQGEISKPFWTNQGLHIVKLDEKIVRKDRVDFDREVRKILFEKKFTQRYETWMRELREKSFIEIRL